MERAGTYLVTEELITSIAIRSEEDRVKAATLYNISSYFLDNGISAWYKRNSSARFESSITDWKDKLNALLKIPWITPICSWKEGLDIPFVKTINIDGAPHYLMVDVNKTLFGGSSSSATTKLPS